MKGAASEFFTSEGQALNLDDHGMVSEQADFGVFLPRSGADTRLLYVVDVNMNMVTHRSLLLHCDSKVSQSG